MEDDKLRHASPISVGFCATSFLSLERVLGVAKLNRRCVMDIPSQPVPTPHDTQSKLEPLVALL
eukprot:12549569-Prorocentrum_lima.AAC.1